MLFLWYTVQPGVWHFSALVSCAAVCMQFTTLNNQSTLGGILIMVSGQLEYLIANTCMFKFACGTETISRIYHGEIVVSNYWVL